MQVLLVGWTIVGWSFGFFLAKILADRYHPGYYQIISTLCAVLLIPLYYQLGLTSNTGFPFNFKDILLGILTFMLMNSATLTLTIAYKYNNNAAIITAISNLYIIGLVVLSNLFLAEKISLKQIVGIILMVFGVFLIK